MQAHITSPPQSFPSLWSETIVDNCGLVTHFWLATAIPWLQKFSLVEVGQGSIVCIWDAASRVRTSAHCVSSLGASGLKLIIPLGIMPLFLEKGSDSPTALYHIWHLEDENPFWVPSCTVSEFLILPKRIHGGTAWPCSCLVISMELQFIRKFGNPISRHAEDGASLNGQPPLAAAPEDKKREQALKEAVLLNAGMG